MYQLIPNSDPKITIGFHQGSKGYWSLTVYSHKGKCKIIFELSSYSPNAELRLEYLMKHGYNPMVAA